ncbi:hypothetical protein scyTo_0015068 [Scyliorhinus torazame]|uniref:Uncharacterized protein n=1 Tax=Scyliorhinus torazame TaxID=75743 RepID=A0A401P1L2_SCYTO|nr:hypothetical protein [Scyliorhinus torazame]
MVSSTLLHSNCSQHTVTLSLGFLLLFKTSLTTSSLLYNTLTRTLGGSTASNLSLAASSFSWHARTTVSNMPHEESTFVFLIPGDPTAAKLLRYV